MAAMPERDSRIKATQIVNLSETGFAAGDGSF
jgi:hypothetical protein